MKRIFPDIFTHRHNTGWLPVKLLAACSMVFVSCEEIMDVSFTGNSDKTLVIEGSITTDTIPHLVQLSYTGDFFDTDSQEMVTAEDVTLFDGENTFRLYESSKGMYYTDPHIYGEVGKTYTLHVKLYDGREFTATDEIRPVGKIDSIEQSANYKSFTEEYGYDVLFYGREPEPAGDNYLYLVYVNNELYSDTISEITFANDEFVNGRYVRDLVVSRIRESDVNGAATEIVVEMYSISRNYYDFLSALMLETIWKGSPWDGPPASVAGNISNGGRGFFRASDVSRYTTYFFRLPRVN